MDYSYNSDWNDFVKIECEKLKKKRHVFDAEGTHMKIISEKYQKKLAREAKKKQTTSNPSSHPQKLTGALAKADEAYYIHMRQKAEAEAKVQPKVDAKKKQTTSNPSSHPQKLTGALAKADEAYYIHMRQKAEAEAKVQAKVNAKQKQQEELARVQKEAEAKLKQEQLAFEAKRRDEMLKIRAKQQEELVRVQNEAEAKRKQNLEDAKALQELLEAREKEAKRAEEERRFHEIAAEKHREELEKANARANELEEILKAKERDEITKSNARMKSLNEILKANARAKELEAIVKANNEEIKAELEKERAEFARFKAATILNVEIANESSMAKCNIVSKLEIALKKEIERRKHDKNPVKFRLMRKSKTESKLALALKEVINHRMKIKLGLL
jgi:colicin import membrane protein